MWAGAGGGGRITTREDTATFSWFSLTEQGGGGEIEGCQNLFVVCTQLSGPARQLCPRHSTREWRETAQSTEACFELNTWHQVISVQKEPTKMSTTLRRSSRRTDTQSQVSKVTKKSVVDLLRSQIENKTLEMKPCHVSVLKLQECKGHYKAPDIMQPTHLSKHEKGK